LSYDVAIIGGGPAGSTAAYRLATAGARVLIVDKATFPRDKPCGGGVTGRAARLLPFSIEPVVEDTVSRMNTGLRYRRHVARTARKPIAYMTQRSRLDHFLLTKAADAGAEIREGTTVDARELDARIVIGADGCNGSSAKQLGLMENVAYGVALEANYPWEKRFAGAMALEIAIIRGGYGWIFPKGDHINVGVGGNEAEGPKLRAELRRMCEAHGIDPDSASRTRGYRLPMRAAGTTLARELAHRYRKPLLVADLGNPEILKHATLWLRVQEGRHGENLALAIGGPRESEAPGIYARAKAFIAALL